MTLHLQNLITIGAYLQLTTWLGFVAHLIVGASCVVLVLRPVYDPSSVNYKTNAFVTLKESAPFVRNASAADQI